MEQAHTEASRETLVDTTGLTAVEICTKCGKLAVSGLCDDTMQGDMTMREYFVPGTEPEEFCDCHVRLCVCADSGKQAATWCPFGSRETDVYLTGGTAGTADAACSAEEILGTTCDVHTHLHDLFRGDRDEPDREEEQREEDSWDWWQNTARSWYDTIDDWGLF